jgi:4-amino-4-deoxychorismate lyase
VVQTLLAVLGAGVVDPSTPVIRADDPGVTRGDGCFEGIRVLTDPGGTSRPAKLDRHLARWARSAAALGIGFDASAWRELIELACASWTDPGEAALRAVLTRGSTGFLMITPLPADYPRQRRDGISAITLDRGYASDAFETAPWLLGGVKTLSYAINMAAQREAVRHGADDAIFLSTDGYVLEAPTGTVAWARGRTLATTPLAGTGILAGTTQQLLFENAEATGWTTRSELVRVAELRDADAVWIISSVRGPVQVVQLDGVPCTHAPELDAEIKKLSEF